MEKDSCSSVLSFLEQSVFWKELPRREEEVKVDNENPDTEHRPWSSLGMQSSKEGEAWLPVSLEGDVACKYQRYVTRRILEENLDSEKKPPIFSKKKKMQS